MSERRKDHEAMVQRWIDNAIDPPHLSYDDVYSLVHLLETVSDREREALGKVVEDACRERERFRVMILKLWQDWESPSDETFESTLKHFVSEATPSSTEDE